MKLSLCNVYHMCVIVLYIPALTWLSTYTRQPQFSVGTRTSALSFLVASDILVPLSEWAFKEAC